MLNIDRYNPQKHNKLEELKRVLLHTKFENSSFRNSLSEAQFNLKPEILYVVGSVSTSQST